MPKHHLIVGLFYRTSHCYNCWSLAPWKHVITNPSRYLPQMENQGRQFGNKCKLISTLFDGINCHILFASGIWGIVNPKPYKDSTMVFYIFSLLGAFPLFPRTCVIWQLSMKSWVAYRLVSNFAIPTRHTHNITYMHTFRPLMLIRLQTHYIYEMYESKNTLLSMFVKLSQCFPKLQNLSNVKWLFQAQIHTHITKN
jgi:hypothetical protein